MWIGSAPRIGALLLCVAVFVAGRAFAEIPDPAERLRAHSIGVIERLRDREIAWVVGEFHFPPHYSADQVRSDKTAESHHAEDGRTARSGTFHR
jgi:hypothetical protein